MNIRFADESDLTLIYNFIIELAEFEKLRHEVCATEDLLEQYLFGKEKRAEVIIAELDERPAGFALFFHTFSTFLGKPGIYLEDLYVYPKFRGKSVGKSLLVYLAKIARERNCGRLEWSVLDWNENAINFYRRLGSVSMDEWTVHRVSGDALSSLAGMD